MTEKDFDGYGEIVDPKGGADYQASGKLPGQLFSEGDDIPLDGPEPSAADWDFGDEEDEDPISADVQDASAHPNVSR